MVGVNGTGKTTTVGKLARVLVAEDKQVVLGAADTFRAAAAEQLATWGERVGVPAVRGPEGSDPASVAFEAVRAGIEQEADVVLVDTAGRLQNKAGLMDELGKVKRVVEKLAPVAEVLLVLDATTGQNGLQQARVFSEVVDVTGIVLTKLDGSAKGGIVVAVQRELGVPVKLVGLGEGADDLAPFDPDGVRRRAAGRVRRGLTAPDVPRPQVATVGGLTPAQGELHEVLDVLDARHRPVRDRADRQQAAQPLDRGCRRRCRRRTSPRSMARSNVGARGGLTPLGRGPVQRGDAVVAHRLRDGRAQERRAVGGVHEGQHRAVARVRSSRSSRCRARASPRSTASPSPRRRGPPWRASAGRPWPCRRRLARRRRRRWCGRSRAAAAARPRLS